MPPVAARAPGLLSRFTESGPALPRVRVPPLRRRFARLVLPAAAEAALDGRAKILMFFGGRLAG